jgi:enterochelin esterase-like enzyme
MPSDGLTGDGSGYLPHLSKDHEKWIVQDVIEAINYHFQEISRDSLAFISGLSMGGYGALHLGMKHHYFFSGISAHSSITDLNDLQTFIDEDIRQCLTKETIESSSIIDHAKKYRNNLPPLRFDCGTDDQLLDSNRRLHQALTEQKIDHLYQEFSGAHTYEYWTKHIEDSLIFFNSLC